MMLSIGQLAKRANVSNRTLRYYEELGLIRPIERGENRYRYYHENQLDRLANIRMLQESGFSLKEIVSSMTPDLSEDKNPNEEKGQQLARKIFDAIQIQTNKLIERQREIEQTIKELQGTMDQLKACFACEDSQSLMDCSICKKGPVELTGAAKMSTDRFQPENKDKILGNLGITL